MESLRRSRLTTVVVLACLAAAACSRTAEPPAPERPVGLSPVAPEALAALRAQQPTRAALAQARLEALRPALGLDAQASFELVGVATDAFGQTHARFAQRHAGIRVFGAQAVMHTAADGSALAPTLALAKPSKVATTPALGAADAIAAADRELGRKGSWSHPPKAELVLWPVYRSVPLRPVTPGVTPNAMDFRREVADLVLAYHVHTELENAEDGVRHTDFVVDAHTGRTVHSWSSLRTAVGRSQYSGTVSIGSKPAAGGGFQLWSTTIPHATTNLNMTESGGGTVCSDLDDDWGDGRQFDRAAPSDDANGQTAAVDATYGAEKTWTFYEQVLGRTGIDGAGTFTFSRVHYATRYDNAFWSDSCFCMTYGDGSGREIGGFDTLTSIDVIAHEFSHGVTSTTASLVYDGESGGLNEATSDIFGAMVEFYARGGGGSAIGSSGGNWEIGEQLSDRPLRFMDRPSDDGFSPDAWFPGIGTVDVHYSSGPMNRAFHFLAAGASADPTARSHSEYLPVGMEGIGNDAAAAIWYQALTTYLTPTSDYVAARTAALRAAADLYGRASTHYAAVRSAFAGINVGWADGTGDDLTSPTVDLSLAGGPGAFRFTATATDSGAIDRAELYVAGSPVATDTSAPYQFGFDALLGHGSHEAFVVAFDASGNFGVSAPLALEIADASQLLLNPGFEENPSVGWTGDPIVQRGYPAYARRGTGFAYVGGYGAAYSDTIEQTVAIPADAAAAFSFQVNVVTDEAPGAAYDTFTVKVLDENGATLATPVTLSNLDAVGGWATQVVDLSAYAGRTVTLQLQSVEDPAVSTAFFVDEATVRTYTAADDVTAPVAACAVHGTRGTVALAVDATDDGAVASAALFVDGVAAGTVAGRLVGAFDTTALADGAHELTATVADAAGNTAQCTTAFHVDNTAAQLVGNSSFEQYTVVGTARRPTVWTWLNARNYPGYGNRTGDFSLALNGLNLSAAPDGSSSTSSASQALAIPADSRPVVLRYYLTTYSTYPDGQPHDTFRIKLLNQTGTELATLATWRDNDWPGGYDGQLDLSAYAGQTITLQLESTQAKAPYFSYFFLDDVELHVAPSGDGIAPEVAVQVYGNAGIIGVEGIASDDFGVAGVKLLVDGAIVAESDPLFPGTVYGRIGLAAGTHEATAVATDLAGHVAETTTVFDVVAPPADEASPVVSASVDTTLETVTLHAAATDDLGVAVVEFYVDGAIVGRDTAAPYGLELPAAGFGETTHVVVARAYDAAEKMGASAPVVFAVGNDEPVANAGADVAVDEGASVTLQGSATDADGDTLTYAWAQTSGTTVALSSASAAQPTFTAPLVSVDTALVFTLTVTDGLGGSSTDSVTVTVRDVPPPPPPNAAPVANAGADVTVNERALVTLQGSATDPDADVLTYAWTQTGGSEVALSSASAAKPTFTAPAVDADTTLTFTLTVGDGRLSGTDTVTVTVQNVVTGGGGGGGCSTGGDPSGTLLPILGVLAAVWRRRRAR